MEDTAAVSSSTAAQLPDSHPIEGFEDAKRQYKYNLPPFAHKGTFGLRTRVTVAQWQDEHRSSNEVVQRRWNQGHMFSTIDLHGQRYIVGAFGCTGGGIRYHCWDGSIQDFGTYAVAYSWPRGVADRLEYLKETYRPFSDVKKTQTQSPSSVQPLVQNNTGDVRMESEGKTSRTISTPRSASDYLGAPDTYQQAASGQNLSLDLSPKSSTVTKIQNVETHPRMDSSRETAPATFSDPWKSSNTSLKVPATTTSPQVGPCCSFMPVGKPPERDDASYIQQSEKRSRDETRSVEYPSVDVMNKKRRHHSDLDEDSNNTESIVSHNISPNYPSPRPSFSSRPSQGDLDQLACTPTERSHMTNTSEAPLSLYKQRHTTLRILLPLSSDFIPLRLGSCTTASSMFETAIAITGSKDQDMKISGLRITFDWKSDRDVDKAMLIKQEYPESFEIVLETIGQAPCWRSDGGRCSVGVEVVLE